VRATIGAAAWLAALFVFAFIAFALSDLLRSSGSAFATGIFLCTLAAVAFATMARFDFVTQFAFATSIAGQAAFGAGVFEVHGLDRGVALLALAAFQGVLAFLVRYPVHRVWCMFAAAVALMLAFHQWHAAALFPGLVACAIAAIGCNEARLARHCGLLQPALTGLALVLLTLVPAAVITSPFVFGGTEVEVPSLRAAGAVLAAAALASTVVSLLTARGVAAGSRRGAMAVVAALLAATLAWPFPGMIAAVVLVLVAYEGGNRVLTGVGLVALCGALGYYYYSLEVTLLVKSGALVGAGLVLLAARWAINRSMGGAEETIHA